MATSGSTTLEFVDKFAIFGKGIGLPKSTARVLGLLSICTPEVQTAVQIQQTLHLSTGSVSTALAMLIGMQLVERVKQPGVRTVYYRLVPNGFVVSVQRRFQTFKLAEEIAQFGLEHAPNDRRLIAMKDLYSLLDREMRDVAKKLDELA